MHNIAREDAKARRIQLQIHFTQRRKEFKRIQRVARKNAKARKSTGCLSLVSSLISQVLILTPWSLIVVT